ncbi:MAG: DUF4105 domain-containing protein [Treponema sp.]|jgi:hypothetical protein|nr:DUF4105 domain-containing protein [Treponema sp.]
MKTNKYQILILLFVIICVCLAAQEQGDYLTIKIVEIGPGDEFFSWWGHLAVMVDNELTGRSLFYDFGVFSFDDPNLVRNVLKGDLNYNIIVSNAQDDLAWYKQHNQDITLYSLNLDSRQKEQIAYALNWNVQPQNSKYLYKIFTDNCVTRIMLIIDDALNGTFIEKYKNENGRFTLRGHAGRHFYHAPLLYLFLNFIMGEEIDKPSSKYDEMYLPSELTAALADFTYTDINGNIQPLVSGIERINTSIGRPTVLSRPPNSWLYAFLAGMIMAIFFMLLIIFQKKNRGLPHVFYISQSLIALCWASMGTVLFYTMFFSHHSYTYNNLNILYANPLLFTAVPMGILCAFTKQERKIVFYSRILRALWTYVLIGVAVSIVLRFAGLNYTDNTFILLLLTPSALVLSCGAKIYAKLPTRRNHGIFHQ